MGIREFFVNDGPMYTFVAVWMGINVFLFVYFFEEYEGPEWTFVRVIVHQGLPIARGAANVLNFNSALIVLPVCRNLVHWTRGCFQCRRSIRRLFDKNILFHKWCAYVICFASALHICAHLFNVDNLTKANGDYPRVPQGTSDVDVAFNYLAGFTGVVITLVLILMVTTAVEQIRRSYFELFWYMHHLFIVYYVFMGIHGISGFVEKETNYNDVPFYENGGTFLPSGICDSRQNPNPVAGCTGIDSGCATAAQIASDTRKTCCPCFNDEANIIPGGPGSYKWIIGPLFLYICERIYRFYQSFARSLPILRVVRLPDSQPVMEIQFKKVKTEPGQYVFINCPSISQLEWHPFTLTSCPELDYCSVHIRIVGDWTSKFAEAVGFYNEDQTVAYRLPNIAIDGPFGTSSEDFFRYDVGVMIGAGIGVTPFVSLLKSLFFLKCDEARRRTLGVKKVYFYWLCPGFDAWTWFATLLMDMEEKLSQIGELDFLEIRIHMTRGWSRDDAAKIILQDNEQGDTVIRDQDGRCLRHKMNFGRPNWDVEFDAMTRAHPSTNIGVFFCGPKVLSTDIHKKCNTHTDATTATGTRFTYNKENF